MNIFVTDLDPAAAARNQCDEHVRKMVIEYAQMLSTAHRLIDGVQHTFTVKHPHDGKTYKFKHQKLGNEGVEFQWGETPTGRTKLVPTISEQVCYRAAHPGHPCSIWARANNLNYAWLAAMYDHTGQEYTHRYGKVHAASRHRDFLMQPPKFIACSDVMTPFPQAMPDEYKHQDVVAAYRAFYLGDKARFASWNRNRDAPTWWQP